MTDDRARITPFLLRRAIPADREPLVDIWWRSACATHRFLTQSQLDALLPDVRALRLERLDTWVLCEPPEIAVGFLTMDGGAIDALFIAPEWQRRGGGRFMVNHARGLAPGLTVEVNEQNVDAVEFYRAQGFVVTGRAETDSAGRPYPLLRMAESPGLRLT